MLIVLSPVKMTFVAFAQKKTLLQHLSMHTNKKVSSVIQKLADLAFLTEIQP
jgi:hypothetical protein